MEDLDIKIQVYNFTKDTDLSSVLTYSHNKHKYNSSSLKYTAYDDAKYNSKVIDFQMRLGSKFSSNESYIKPFIGFGITNRSLWTTCFKFFC